MRPIASLFTRFELREKYDEIKPPAAPANDRNVDSDTFRYRARFGLETKKFDLGASTRVQARFVPQASGLWGVGGDTLVDANLDLHEGYLTVHGPAYRAEVGRFEMVYGEHFVIGNVDWHETGRSFDGGRLHVAPKDTGFWIDAFFTLLDEGFAETTVTMPGVTVPAPQGDPFAVGDTLFAGLYAGLGGIFDPKMEWDLYVLSQIDPVSRVTNAMTGVTTELDAGSRFTIGTRAKQRVGILDYRLEAGVQLGHQPDGRDALAYQGDLELGLNADAARFRFAGEAFFASGDDPTSADTNEGWNQLFPTAHKWLGYSDIIGGRSNIGGGVVHLSYKPLEKLSTYADLHIFMRPEAAAAGGPNGYVATELDLGVGYALGAGLNSRVGYALFMPKDDFYQGRSEPVHFLEVELRYDIK